MTDRLYADRHRSHHLIVLRKRDSGAARPSRGWAALQLLIWLLGFACFAALLFAPEIGLHAFWNVLIPIAPALFAVAPGLWRNTCPMGTTAMLTRKMGLSRRVKLSPEGQGRLGLAGVALLLAIVPLRHVILDLSGVATAVAIAGLALIAVGVGVVFEWKSGWCSGMCPVHPVEKLYGTRPFGTMPNAHCESCQRCVSVCPDSVPAPRSVVTEPLVSERIAAAVMVGGFPGFVWGWFHVPNRVGADIAVHLPIAYGVPLLGLACTLAIYLVLRRILPARLGQGLNLTFGAAAICCYYWYRLPSLFGFGLFPGDGMLVDLSGVLPSWAPVAAQVTTTALLLAWFLRRAPVRSWLSRPELAERVRAGGPHLEPLE